MKVPGTLAALMQITAVYFANKSTFDDITLRMGNIEKERHNNPPRMIKEQVHSRKAHYNNENV